LGTIKVDTYLATGAGILEALKVDIPKASVDLDRAAVVAGSLKGLHRRVDPQVDNTVVG
jgi:hypothetical protein